VSVTTEGTRGDELRGPLRILLYFRIYVLFSPIYNECTCSNCPGGVRPGGGGLPGMSEELPDSTTDRAIVGARERGEERTGIRSRAHANESCTMLVSGFMVPRDKVYSVAPTDPIRDIGNIMANKYVGCVVVLNGMEAVGIVTKTDMTRAFMEQRSLTSQAQDIMKKNLVTVESTMSRDEAAEVFERYGVHHAIVLQGGTGSGSGNFVGLISAWDVAREVVLDSKAWPWSRPTSAGQHGPFPRRE